MSKVIGIDLGTTNSAVAVMVAGKPKIIPTSEGTNTFPSIVDPIGHSVGATAKRQMILKSDRIINSVKRLMGRKITDPEVKKTMEHVSYKIVAGKDQMAVVEIPAEGGAGAGKKFTPQEISAMTLGKAKADAEAFLGEKVTQAVITVPAYFDDAQRQATKQAGEIAGLKVERILNEPTAAALAYGLDQKKNETIAVYDLGGGTFDISILEIGDGVFEVKSTNGNTFLGGDDFDGRVIDWIISEFKKENNVDLKKDKQALQRVKDSAEKAKIELSSAQTTEINLPFITQGSEGPLHLTMSLTRSKLEELVDDLITGSFKPVEQALKDAGIKKTDIHEVVLVGGMTRMPKVQEAVQKFFGKEPHKGVNPDEVVAVGAAVQAGVITGDVKDVVLLDVTPLTLGLETMGGVRTSLIPRNTTVPTSKSQIFSTAADSQTQVEINVLQGEREMASDNKSLGRFILDGIPPAPRGMPQIEVTFDIDTNGILHVTAKDKTSGKEQKISIQNSTNLSKEDVEKMVAEAEAHREEDEAKKKLIETKNQAEHSVFELRKQLKEYGAHLSDADREQIEKNVNELEVLSKKEDVTADELQKALEETMQGAQKIGEAMQKANAANPSASSGQDDQQKAEAKKEDAPVEEGEVVKE